jgi:hypothetical protein
MNEQKAMIPTKPYTAVFWILLLTLAFGLSSAIKAQDNASAYKLTDAGIQFNVPPGWHAEKDPNGTTIVAKKEADGFVVFAVSVLPVPPNASVTLEAAFGAFSEGVLGSVKKDWKDFKPDEPVKDTENGMNVMIQSFKGSLAEAGEMEGLVILFDSPKPVGIFAQRTKKHSDALEKESTDWLKSFRKIE